MDAETRAIIAKQKQLEVEIAKIDLALHVTKMEEKR